MQLWSPQKHHLIAPPTYQKVLLLFICFYDWQRNWSNFYFTLSKYFYFGVYFWRFFFSNICCTTPLGPAPQRPRTLGLGPLRPQTNIVNKIWLAKNMAHLDSTVHVSFFPHQLCYVVVVYCIQGSVLICSWKIIRNVVYMNKIRRIMK